MVYILGHRPNEFGLVPDVEGFVTYKELLWAINEEPGWGYVRQGHIHEVLSGKNRALFQAEDNQIRVFDRHWHLDLDDPSHSLSKILFIPVRRKAHSTVMKKGLISIEGKYLALSSDRDMALRMGRRRDQTPVLLEIMATAAQKEGIYFYSFGHLLLTNQIHARFIFGPPVSKEEVTGPREKAVKKKKRGPDSEAGTFVLDINRDPDLSRRVRGKKRRGWKEEARKETRRKRRA